LCNNAALWFVPPSSGFRMVASLVGSYPENATLVPWLVLASALFVAAIGTAVLRRLNP